MIRRSLALDDANLAYRSDTRGRDPYRCIVEGRVLKTIEIPTTLPTLDEVMGLAEIPDAAAAHRFYLEQFKEDALNVHTVHAETEGMGQLEMFTALLRALKERGAEFVRLEEVASGLDAARAPGLPGDSFDLARPRRLDFRAGRSRRPHSRVLELSFQTFVDIAVIAFSNQRNIETLAIVSVHDSVLADISSSIFVAAQRLRILRFGIRHQLEGFAGYLPELFRRKGL